MSLARESRLPDRQADSRILWKTTLIAFLIEVGALTAAGWHQHWLAHPPRSDNDASKFIEAQVYQVPQDAHLIDQSKSAPLPSKKEATLSKVPNRGRKAKSGESKVQEENQTKSGPPPLPTHGPVAIFSPPPVIPAYLQSNDLHASVVIDFYVSAQGSTSPKLVGSSGNEELDAIAIAAAKKWQFRPGEKDHHPIDSKVRLRIVFEVK